MYGSLSDNEIAPEYLFFTLPIIGADGYIEKLTHFIERGVSLDLSSLELEHYCCANCVDEFQILLELDIDVNNPDGDNYYDCLSTACFECLPSIRLVCLLLEAGLALRTDNIVCQQDNLQEEGNVVSAASAKNDCILEYE